MVDTPIVNMGSLYADNMQMVWVTTATFTVAAGQVRDATNVNDIEIDSAITINTANNGAAGLDTGTIGNSTMYSVWAIDDSTKNNVGSALMSASLDGSTLIMPGGYDMKRLVGYVLTDGSALVLVFWQTGAGRDRIMTYDVQISELAAGNDTSFTDVDLATSVPSIATEVYLVADLTPNSAGNEVKLRVNGSASTNGSAQMSGSAAAVAKRGQMVVNCDSDAVIEYLVSNGSDAVDLLVSGYKYTI